MYWRNYEPVSPDLVYDLHLYPSDYMNEELYLRYYKTGERSNKTGERSIKRYIIHSRTYKYLAFLYVLHSEMGIEDPIGSHWADGWTKELLSSREFLDAHANYGTYYLGFRRHVDRLLSKGNV